MTLAPLYPHQAKEIEENWDKPARALLWGMRSGKTRAILECIDHLWIIDDINAVIIFAPKGVHANWTYEEIPKWCFPHWQCYTWWSGKGFDKTERIDVNFKTRPIQFYAFNHDALRSESAREAIKRILKYNRCALVVDESHHFGSVSSRRSKYLRAIAKRCPWRRILTGTPTGNTPMKNYSQFQILEPGALGCKTLREFENTFGVWRRVRRGAKQFRQYVGSRNEDELTRRIAKWSSVVLREDCEDLPAVTISRRYFELSTEQRATYDALKTCFIAELDNDEWLTAEQVTTRLTRLRQVLSGFVRPDESEAPRILPGEQPRVEMLLKVLEESGLHGSSTGNNIVVWCVFRPDFEIIKWALLKAAIPFSMIHGGTAPDARMRILKSFQDPDGGAMCLLANPVCLGEGIDLSIAETMVWYSHTFDSIHREQANARCTKSDGRPVDVIDLCSHGTLDEYVLDTTAKKIEVADQITGSGLKRILEEP